MSKSKSPYKMAMALCASLDADANARKVKSKAGESAICQWSDGTGGDCKVKYVGEHENEAGEKVPAQAFVTVALDPSMVTEMLVAAGVPFAE